MSVQSAKEFIEKISKDEEFKKSYVALETSEARENCKKEAGFDFTKEEFDEAKSELSDDDLDDVAGGWGVCADVCVDVCTSDFTVCGVN